MSMLALVMAAEATMGPVIKDFGPVFSVKHHAAIPADVLLKAVFNEHTAPEPGIINPQIEKVARYLNMHAQAGIDVKRMRLAMVLHGAATRYALSDAAYQQHFKVADKTNRLLDELIKAGVKVYVCGQSYNAHGYSEQELRPGVHEALSAMTELTVLQQEGYALIP